MVSDLVTGGGANFLRIGEDGQRLKNVVLSLAQASLHFWPLIASSSYFLKLFIPQVISFAQFI